MIDHLPPHSPEAEQGTLGCILQSPVDCLTVCLSRIKRGQDIFYDLRHQTMFDVMVEMFDAGQQIDVITLKQRLKDRNLLDQVGGLAYLSTLPDATPSAANLTYYLDIVLEKALLRRIIKTCTEAVGRAYNYEGDALTLVDELERDILAIRPTDSKAQPLVQELATEAMKNIEAASLRGGGVEGIPTGFIDLDRLTGGLKKAEMTVVAGFSSAGKTSFAMNLAEHALLGAFKKVGVFTLEMTSLQLVTRFICTHARVSLRNVEQGFLAINDVPRLHGAFKTISRCAIYFDDSSDISVYQLRAKARRMWQQFAIELLIVDYLQLLNAMGGPRKINSRQEEVAEISGGIKKLAKELSIPVVVMSQLNDDGKLRESRAIGQDADNVWMLQADKNKIGEPCYPVTLHIVKQRNGPRAQKVELTFIAGITRFESASKISDEDVDQMPIPYNES